MSPIPPWMIPKREQPEKRPEQQPTTPEDDPFENPPKPVKPPPKRIKINPDGTTEEDKQPDPNKTSRGVTTIYMDGEEKKET